MIVGGSDYLWALLLVKDSDSQRRAMIGLLGALGHTGSQGEDFCDSQLNQNITGEKEFSKQRRMPLLGADKTLTWTYFSKERGIYTMKLKSSGQMTLPLGH